MALSVPENVLLIDAGFAFAGFAVFNIEDNCFMRLGSIKTIPLAKKMHVYVADDNVRRCQEICERLGTITRMYNPRAIFAELPTGGARGAKPAMAMAMSVAIVACVAALTRKQLYPIQPLETKRLIGKGVVSKEQVIERVIKLFGDLRCEPNDKGKRLCLSSHPHREHIADAMILIEVVRRRYSNFLQYERGHKRYSAV